MTAPNSSNNCGETYLKEAKKIIDGKLDVVCDDFVGPVNPDVTIAQKEVEGILEGLKDAALNPKCYGPNLVGTANQLDKVSGLNTGIITEEISEVVRLLTNIKLSNEKSEINNFSNNVVKKLKILIQRKIGSIKNNSFEDKKALISLLSEINTILKDRKKAEISKRNLRRAERYPEAA